MNTKQSKLSISSFTLHMLAMGIMLCDHIGFALYQNTNWLRCVGRLAFPIFAFMIVEGYCHTRNIRRYILRMLFWACVSEIPYNLMCTGKVFNTEHQNIMWTLLGGLLVIALVDKCDNHFSKRVTAVVIAITGYLGYVVGTLTNIDYSRIGILTILMFFVFRERTWRNRLAQLAAMYLLNVVMYQGWYSFTVDIFGYNIEIIRQGLAILALIPIWLYQGRQGFHSKAFQVICYAFYPIHMLALVWISRLM